MKNFTFVITCRNNESTLADCIDSCKKLDSEILIADINSSDKSSDIIEKIGCKTIFFGFHNDYAKIKNKIINECETEWMMFLNANEIILKGLDKIQEYIEGKDCRRISVIQEQVITKPIRLINKSNNCIFSNPVFEHISHSSIHSDIFVKSQTIDRYEENMEIIKNWMKEKPLVAQTHYYLSCIYLGKSKWDDFIRTANYYLFLEKNKPMSYFMTKYYLAMIYAYVEKNYKLASQQLFELIIEKPLMAEYWCLLGDIYYSLDKFEKAFHFYENAMLLGSRRLKSDEFPFHIEKYKKHPEEMMLNCKNVINSSKLYKSNK